MYFTISLHLPLNFTLSQIYYRGDIRAFKDVIVKELKDFKFTRYYADTTVMSSYVWNMVRQAASKAYISSIAYLYILQRRMT